MKKFPLELSFAAFGIIVSVLAAVELFPNTGFIFFKKHTNAKVIAVEEIEDDNEHYILVEYFSDYSGQKIVTYNLVPTKLVANNNVSVGDTIAITYTKFFPGKIYFGMEDPSSPYFYSGLLLVFTLMAISLAKVTFRYIRSIRSYNSGD